MDPDTSKNVRRWLGRLVSGGIVIATVTLGLVGFTEQTTIHEPTTPKCSRTSSGSRRKSRARSSG